MNARAVSDNEAVLRALVRGAAPTLDIARVWIIARHLHECGVLGSEETNTP